MARRGGTKKQRFVRSVGMWSAVLMLLSSVSLIAVLIMDLLGFNYLLLETPRTYWVQFENEGEIFFDRKYRRGETIDKPKNPTHSEEEYFSYTFRGWDINGDRTPDAIPSHAFYSFLAVAVYQKRQIKPLPKSSSEPEDESEEGSSSNPDLSSSSAFIIEGGINYGA